MKMTTVATILAAALAGCYSEGPRRPQEVEVYGGQARLTHAERAANRSAGVRYVTPGTEYGVQGVVGLGVEQGSAPFDGETLDQQRVTGDLGFRLGRDLGPFRAYAGLGLAPEYARLSATTGERDQAWALAGYAVLGSKVLLGRGASLGLELRQTSGAVFHVLDDPRVDLDERTLALTLGWSW